MFTMGHRPGGGGALLFHPRILLKQENPTETSGVPPEQQAGMYVSVGGTTQTAKKATPKGRFQ